MQKRVGVLLSGCGFMDGAEIQEAVLTLLALDRAGAKAICMAPNKETADVVDHLSGQTVANERRNVLVESARIARGEIQEISDVDPSELDALALPGGFGVAKNLCNFAAEGENCVADEQVVRLLREVRAADKPIAALCIAPSLIARVFGEEIHPTLTIGEDQGVATKLETMGAKHESVRPDQIVVDRGNNIVSTPCYMSAQSISEVATGIDKAITALLSMIPAGANA